jgi:hypothetical protein
MSCCTPNFQHPPFAQLCDTIKQFFNYVRNGYASCRYRSSHTRKTFLGWESLATNAKSYSKARSGVRHSCVKSEERQTTLRAMNGLACRIGQSHCFDVHAGAVANSHTRAHLRPHNGKVQIQGLGRCYVADIVRRKNQVCSAELTMAAMKKPGCSKRIEVVFTDPSNRPHYPDDPRTNQPVKRTRRRCIPSYLPIR